MPLASVTVPVGVRLPLPPLTATVTVMGAAEVIVAGAGVKVTVGVVTTVEAAPIFSLAIKAFPSREFTVVWNAAAVTGKSKDTADPVTYTFPLLSRANAVAWSPSPNSRTPTKSSGLMPFPPM